MANSQNGFPANDRTRVQPWLIPGTTRTVTLARGNPGWLLVHFAAWFNANIERIDVGEYDDWGYAERNIRGSATTISNHASGTAIDLNAVKHPLGKVGTFTPDQTRRIRDRLKLYQGAIRWGGDYSGRKDEMHFEINRSVIICNAIANTLADIPVVETDFLMSLSGDEQRKLADQVNYLYAQLTQPFQSWRYNGKQESLTVVDYLRGLDRELRSAFTLDGRPGGDSDSVVGHVLSERVEIRELLQKILTKLED